MVNGSLEVGISIEGDSYSFSIDCNGFSNLFQRCYDSLLPEPKTGEWVFEEIPESDMDMMHELKAVFGSLSDFPLATYHMSDTLFSGNEEYTIEIEMDSDGMARNKYPRIDVDLIHVAHDDFFRYNEWLSDEDKLYSFAFVIDGVTYKMKNKNPSGVWTLSENGQKVVDAMKNAKSTLMKFTFKKAGEITYKLDGRKFAECYEAAKTIPVV